jgi:predicted nucleic acid-binding protein
MKVNAVFDNTVFNIASRITSCDLINLALNHFSTILVPLKIHQEIQNFPRGIELNVENKMMYYARKITLDNKKLELCQTYDTIILALYKGLKNIDEGEAEAIAQAEKRQSRFFISDDEKCVEALKGKNLNIQIVSTLFLIALLDCLGLIPDYPRTIQEYMNYKPLPKKGGKTYFRNQYKMALQYLGLYPDKKLLSVKTSFKELGIT